METYIPYYHRPPNRFLYHEEVWFQDRSGNSGHAIVAVYHDKNGQVKRETAQVIWDE